MPSFWLSEIAPVTQRPCLDSSYSTDIAIVGGGYSGLWTAYYLSELDPTLKIAIFEKEIVGYGASGRNGGWVSSLFPIGWTKVAAYFGDSIAKKLSTELVETVDEVGERVRSLGIECFFLKSGELSLIRNPAQAERAQIEIGQHEERGLAGGWRMLDSTGAEAYLRATFVQGATFTPECATVQPARLVRGLADALEGRGVAIFEGSEVTILDSGGIRIGLHKVVVSKVVVATEGYTSGFDQWHRQLLPLYSMMIATDPLSDSQYQAIGSPPLGLCFADHRNLRIYGQITSDRRIAFGGRGAPYHWGSVIRRAHDTHGPTRDGLEREFLKLFPALEGIRIIRHWGGPLGVSRDWLPRVVSENGGSTWRIGGYAGDGVAAANMAARVLAKRILGISDDSAAAIVLSKPPREWEPEPVRWLGINAGLMLTRVVDHREDRGARSESLDHLRRVLIGQA